MNPTLAAGGAGPYTYAGTPRNIHGRCGLCSGLVTSLLQPHSPGCPPTPTCEDCGATRQSQFNSSDNLPILRMVPRPPSPPLAGILGS